MKRSEARDLAFTLVFEKAFLEDSMEDIIADAAEARLIEEDDFALSLARSVGEHLEEIDALISHYSDKWKIGRLPRVTLSVLRLALCELRYFDDIPYAATINEAVELAKKYSTQDDAAYANGVLGAYVKDLAVAAEK